MPNPPVIEVNDIQKGLNYDLIDLGIADQRITARVADTQQKRYTGLSDTEELGKNEGMLFQYPHEKTHRLIMRDMDFPVDVVHVGADGHITKWGSMTEKGEAVEGMSQHAIELPYGWCEKHGVEEGDPVKVLDPPENQDKIEKERRYIEDPSEAPEEAEVEEGPQGGYYYETEGTSEATEEEPEESESVFDSFHPSESESKIDLSDVEGEMGTNAENMEIHTLSDGSEAYVTTYGEDAANPESRDRAMVGHEVADMLGAQVPDHKMGEEGDWVAVQGVEGEEAWKAPDEWKEQADPEQYINECAAQILMGNIDTHPGNFMLTEDGEVSFIDVDASGRDMFEEDYEGGPQQYNTPLSNMSIGYQDIFGEQREDLDEVILDRASELAEITVENEDIDETLGQASEYNEEFAENIRSNITNFAEGGV